MNEDAKKKLFIKSLEMIETLSNELNNSCFIDCGPRLELVHQCIQISIKHNIGINYLLVEELSLQAMILFRAQFEAIVRAYWLLFLATNNQVTKLKFNWTFEEQFQSDTCPMINEMLTQLLKANLPAQSVIEHLSNFKKYHLKQLNSFVHTGKQSFTRNNVGFNNKMVLTLMRQSNNLITVATQIMLKHTIPDNQKFIKFLMKEYRECFFLDEDVDLTIKTKIDHYFN
ncbi:DUF6988 family protein [Acinetobacter ursingii]|uniref:DUF6988 family protein n=1 Tax=Acinetobacter ursingii TaxID=108980 RepID=UPI0032B5959C